MYKYNRVVDALLVASVHALRSDPGKVLSIDILCEETPNVALISGHVLPLQFVGGPSDPSGSILDFVETRHSFGGVHDYEVVKLYNYNSQSLSPHSVTILLNSLTLFVRDLAVLFLKILFEFTNR